MGFLKHLRSRSKLKSQEENRYAPLPSPQAPSFTHPSSGYDCTKRLPDKLIQRICASVCPHALDHSYVTSEQSSVGDGCMLCDMRDLARLAQVNRRWYKQAQSILYTSVRIDAVHYCELEAVLDERRNRKSFRKSTTEGVADIPAIRLSLFYRTIRDSQMLANQVEILKLPYMTRETCKGDLAATVSRLPNLHYVDLPEGVATGDHSCTTLVGELQTRCPQIRKIRYAQGAEGYLEALSAGHWKNLEELDISGIAVEPGLLRMVLATLQNLRKVSLSDLPWLNDTVFHASPDLPPFPPLQALTLAQCPQVTSAGLKSYLESPACRRLLSSLTLKRTGITVPSITEFLYDATHLKSFTFIAKVGFADSLSLTQTPPLASISLQTLTYEITDSGETAKNISRPSSAFYSYLARTLHSNNLPNLKALYVRDPNFPDLMLLPPPPTFGSPPPSILSTPLEIFSKQTDEEEYIYTFITPSLATQNTSNSDPGQSRSPSLRSVGGRPLSAYNASRGLGPQWGSPDSVMVGNGFGGFLAVPRDGDVPRPKTSGSDRATFLAPPNFNTTPGSSPRLGHVSSHSASVTGSGWPAAVVGNGETGGRFMGAFASENPGPNVFGSPKSLSGSFGESQWGSPGKSQWGSPAMSTGKGIDSPGGRFGGLVARVGGNFKGKGRGEKLDLWR